MSYTDKFEAFSLIKNNSTYKLFNFSEQQNEKSEDETEKKYKKK